jgi:hypothetical protein
MSRRGFVSGGIPTVQIYSIWVATLYPQAIIGILGKVRSANGVGRLLDCPSLYLIGHNKLTCQNRLQGVKMACRLAVRKYSDLTLQKKRFTQIRKGKRQ